jgi:hypothetical protein
MRIDLTAVFASLNLIMNQTKLWIGIIGILVLYFIVVNILV